MDDVVPASSLTPCPICGRTFRPDALARHQRVCEKTKAKQRKVFDSSKQRVEGTEMKNALKQVPSSPKVQKAKPRTNWKEKHEELIRTIRAARGEDTGPTTDGNTNGTTGSRPAIPAGYVECPTCNRNFSDRAADRHIAWCQERNNRIPPKSPASAEAVERLKARTKYKVPTPGKKNGTVSPSGSHGSKELAYKTVASKAVAGNHKRTKSSPSMLEANGTSTGHPKKAAVNRKAKLLPAPPKLKTTKAGGGVMKFKEKFPNHVSSPHRYTDDGYDPYKKADLQMRELIRGTTLAPKNPRTVPGVRTQGLHNNTSSNTSDSNSYTSTNSSGSENRLDEEMNFLNSKFAELARPGFTGEFTNNWAKRMNDNAVTVLSVQDSSNGAPHGSRLADHEPQTSSSGSDGSLLGYGSTGSSAPEPKVPYLCHQCGTVYPVSAAKFCYECGARRLGLIALYGQ
uniref:C2HC/C3H-type domain-containing protein n=1 Tax=Ixodes ricinus TaxID=34613 RepID=A0A147BC18_IXORI